MIIYDIAETTSTQGTHIAQGTVEILQNNLCQVKERERELYLMPAAPGCGHMYISKASISLYLLRTRLMYCTNS